MSVTRAAKLTIDLQALQHNFQLVKQYAPDSPVMPVIKANAYGHGILEVANALNGADGFSVAQLSEAIFLRQNGIDKPITVFQGFTSQQQLEQCVSHGLRPAVSQQWQIDLLDNGSTEQTLDIWLKLDTGMGRLGVPLDEAIDSWRRIQDIHYIKQAGLMMHFANADDPADPSNQQQVERFKSLADSLNTQISVSNSAAIIGGLYEQQNWVRPGIMLYGASPILNKSANELGLQPVMSLQAELIAINQLTRGHAVGYGHNWLCPEDMPVGIVNIGYGDGYPRHAVNGTPVAVNGQIAKLIGRVSMDSIAVDLRGINAKCGDAVELWGKQVSVDEVALQSDTISYELLCNTGRFLS